MWVEHDLSLVDLTGSIEQVLEPSLVNAAGNTADVQVVALVLDLGSENSQLQPSPEDMNNWANSP